MTNGISNRQMNFTTKPKPAELWQERYGPVVEVVEVGMRYARVKTPGGSARFTKMVKFSDLLHKVEPEPAAAPPVETTRPSMDQMNEEFLENDA